MADGGGTLHYNYEPLRDGGSTFETHFDLPGIPQNSVTTRYAKQQINKAYYANTEQYSISSNGIPNIDVLSAFMHLDMDFTNTLTEKDKEMFANIEISEDGKYSISDEVCEYFQGEWEKLGVLDNIKQKEDKQRLSRSLTIVAAYIYLKNPKTRYIKLNLTMLVIPILIRTFQVVKFDLCYPEKFWNWYLGWIRNNYDHFEKLGYLRTSLDMETEICFRLSEHLEKILKKEDPESEKED